MAGAYVAIIIANLKTISQVQHYFVTKQCANPPDYNHKALLRASTVASGSRNVQKAARIAKS